MSFVISNAYQSLYHAKLSAKTSVENKKKFIDGIVQALQKEVQEHPQAIYQDVYENTESLSEKWTKKAQQISKLPDDDLVDRALTEINQISANILNYVKIYKLCQKHGISQEEYRQFSRDCFSSERLAKAVLKNRIDIVGLLLELGEEIGNAVGDAAGQGHVEMMRLLVTSGKVNLDEYFLLEPDHNPLFIAVEKNHLDLVRFFIQEKRADPNQILAYSTPLIEAVRAQHFEMVKLLKECGADINNVVAANMEGGRHSALLVATMLGNTDMMVFLVKEMQADINLEIGDETPLMYALSMGNADIVSKLLELGANVNQQSASGKTPLIHAKEENNPQMIALLESFGADKLYAEKWMRNKKIESIRKNLTSVKNAIHRWGIVLTTLFPFSARGMLFNIAISPLRIPIRFVQSIGPNFWEKFKTHLIRDWNQGIEDTYTDLERADKKIVESVLKEYFPYAFHLHEMSGACGEQEDRRVSGALLKTLQGSPSDIISKEHAQILSDIQKKMIVELGFCTDRSNKYYHKETGVIFDIVYDSARKEVVFYFPGLGAHRLLQLSNNEEEEVGKEAGKAVIVDWMGGIPPSVRQVIAIGNILKETTAGSDLTPVMAGVSHGGGLAQTGAVANGLKGVVFNSRPMGAGTRRYIGQLKISENAKYITAFSGKGDWLTGNGAMNTLAILFERVTGIAVPRTIGKGYYLPELLPSECSYMSYKLGNHLGFYKGFRKIRDCLI